MIDSEYSDTAGPIMFIQQIVADIFSFKATRIKLWKLHPKCEDKVKNFEYCNICYHKPDRIVNEGQHQRQRNQKVPCEWRVKPHLHRTQSNPNSICKPAEMEVEES
jgi:hypothetical protein